jgi:hypothetical protein
VKAAQGAPLHLTTLDKFLWRYFAFGDESKNLSHLGYTEERFEFTL